MIPLLYMFPFLKGPFCERERELLNFMLWAIFDGSGVWLRKVDDMTRSTKYNLTNIYYIYQLTYIRFHMLRFIIKDAISNHVKMQWHVGMFHHEYTFQRSTLFLSLRHFPGKARLSTGNSKKLHLLSPWKQFNTPKNIKVNFFHNILFHFFFSNQFPLCGVGRSHGIQCCKTSAVLHLDRSTSSSGAGCPGHQKGA